MSSRVSQLSLNILDQLSERKDFQYTPDFLELKSVDQIPVFVYGTLKRGFRNHPLVEHLPYLGKARTLSNHYELKEPQHGCFPIMVRYSTLNPHCGRVTGELYVADAKTMVGMDTLESNGSMYRREKVWVVAEEQEFPTKTKNQVARPTVEAWVYFAVPEYWKDQTTIRCPYYTDGHTKKYIWQRNIIENVA